MKQYERILLSAYFCFCPNNKWRVDIDNSNVTETVTPQLSVLVHFALKMRQIFKNFAVLVTLL